MNPVERPAHLEKLELLNWCGKDKVTIPFENRVTFLTGINGSGKSSMLNIIFDSLVLNPKALQKPSTSKHRFWSARATFDNDIQIDSFILPHMQKDKFDAEVELILDRADGDFFDIDILREVQSVYEDNESNSDGAITYIDYEVVPQGEYWRKSITTKIDEKTTEAFSSQKPLGFIFQEDRKPLHKDNESMGSSFYEYAYGSSIDCRFSFIRDAIQVRESHLNKKLVQEFQKLSSEYTIVKLIKEDAYLEITSSQSEFASIIDTLNTYFEEAGKCIVRDDENKITLGLISDITDIDGIEPEPICWHMLSRGEKTLIYLFLSVYFYKDRVTAFLLDEPEISFHVNWQKNLIRDLSEIASKNQFIIATHSPSLVMDGWMGNCLDLKGI